MAGLSFLAEKFVDERLPLSLRRHSSSRSSSAVVPVLCVGSGAFFTVQIGVHRHGFDGFEFIDERVSALPVAFRVPPERREGWRKIRRRLVKSQGCVEFSTRHKNPRNLPAGSYDGDSRGVWQ